MSKEQAPVKKNKKKVNMTKLQLIGFWSVVILLATFWFGTFVGTQATLSSQANEAQIKAQAVESYKASLNKQ